MGKIANPWSEEEIAYLKSRYRKKGATYVAHRLGKNPDHVMAKAARLGLRYAGIRPWKEWEDRYLCRHYEDRSAAQIGRTLKRSVPSIRARAKHFGLTGAAERAWTEKEKDSMRALYSDRKNSLHEIAQLLNRTRNAVLLQAQVLGLKRARHEHEWTKEEHRCLVKNIGKKSYKEIARMLGLSPSAVGHHAVRTGLRKGPMPYSESDREFIITHYATMANKEIGRILNRAPKSISEYARKLGVAGTSRHKDDGQARQRDGE
jgi:DNA-binding CsgD family transcriptional regulator